MQNTHSLWQLYASYKKILKNNTKWTKTTLSKSCLVCSKLTFYSYAKILIGRRLVPDMRHQQEWICLFCQFPLMAKTASQKHLFPPRGFKASIFHLISFPPYFSFPFSPLFFNVERYWAQCLLKHRLSRKRVMLQVCTVPKGYLNQTVRNVFSLCLGHWTPRVWLEGNIRLRKNPLNHSNVEITLAPVGGGMLGSQLNLHWIQLVSALQLPSVTE